jgi:hypothetical protein
VDKLINYLKRRGACAHALRWIQSTRCEDPIALWDMCPCPDWLDWVVIEFYLDRPELNQRFMRWGVEQVTDKFTIPQLEAITRLDLTFNGSDRFGFIACAYIRRIRTGTFDPGILVDSGIAPAVVAEKLRSTYRERFLQWVERSKHRWS